MLIGMSFHCFRFPGWCFRFDLVTYRENSLVGSRVGCVGVGRAQAWALGCAAPSDSKHLALSCTHTLSSAQPQFQSAHSKDLIST